ncbi:unannotated protein [freshwater metagenome]|uniref:Unannotated protein n=1 Tax=freshwater metagenome TaxID=449393 RepID=A0A6J6HZT2_9ZZZZ
MGKLWKRPRTAPASGKTRSDGPRKSLSGKLMVGYTKITENAAIAPAIPQDKVTMRLAETPAKEAASGLSAAARIASP